MTRTAKTFERGEAVEVRASDGEPWQSARYRYHSEHGYHAVSIFYDNGSRALCVPSSRIRKSVTK